MTRKISVILDTDEIKELIEAMDQYANLFGQSLDDAPEEDYLGEVAKYQWLVGIRAHLEAYL